MTSTELELVKPGETVGHIRCGGGQLIDIDIAEGVAPEASTLAAEDSRVFVTTDSMGHADVAVGLEHIHDGQAVIGIEAAGGRSLQDPEFVQKLLKEVMAKSEVSRASINPQAAPIPEEALPRIGFIPDATGEAYTFSLAA